MLLIHQCLQSGTVGVFQSYLRKVLVVFSHCETDVEIPFRHYVVGCCPFKRVLLIITCIESPSIISSVGFVLLSVVLLFFGNRFLAFFVTISSSFGLLSSVPTELLPFAPFSSGNIFQKYEGYLDTRRLASIIIDW